MLEPPAGPARADSLAARLEPWLAPRRATALALGLALAVSLPSVGLGWFMDDYFQQYTLAGLPGPFDRFDLYRFTPAEPDALRTLVDSGPYPWWMYEGTRLAFWRPLSSALAVLDHELYGAVAWPAHLHSILWYLALVAAVAPILRRGLSPALASVALIVFAVDDAHWLPASWLANRNALVASVPALLGLAAHVAWRERGLSWCLPASMLGWAIGLAAGETATGVFGYLVAYELVAGPGPRVRRLLSLVPASALVLAHLVLYKAQGYGAFASATYVDPTTSPGAFLLAAPGRLLALWAAQLAGLPAELWLFAPQLRSAQAACGILAVAGVALLARPALRALPEADRRGLAWLVSGAVLSSLPMAATFPANRLLLLPSIGGAALVAAVLVHALRAGHELSRLARAGTVLLALVHVGLAPLVWPLTAWAYSSVVGRVEAVAASAELDDSTLPRERVVLLHGPDPASAFYPGIMRVVAGRPAPAAWWVLSIAPYDHRVVRTGPDTIVLEVLEGRMLQTVFEQLFRDEAHPLRTGDEVRLHGLDVRVLACDELGPTRVEFRFDRPLEDPSLRFLAWRDGTLRRAELPAVGGTVTLPWSLGVFGPGGEDGG